MSLPSIEYVRKKTKDAQVGEQSGLMRRIETAINLAAQAGEQACSVSAQGYNHATMQAILGELHVAGYSAVHETGDFRDPYNEIRVSW